MNRIHLLPPLLANQIAAGEVIERPASVVKELLENSLDAGATQLEIHLKAGGTALIRIQDNGRGIHPEDLPLALARHATSKIQHAADLAQIATLGFRGEALASIASIARVKVTSQHGDFEARSASIHGRDLSLTLTPAAHPRGTTVEVAELFYNTPARRKFLKSERTEFLHVEELIKRLALARPEVGFALYHDDKLVKRYVAAAQNPILRIEQVLTKSFMEKALRVENEITAFKLEGWLADLEFARSSNDMQYCYVNGRMVRDKMLSHAIRLAFEDKLYPGRFPAYLLHLSCDPSAVDVNVHPTKHEVRFREARTVHDFIVNALQKTLNPIVAAPVMRSTVEREKTRFEKPSYSPSSQLYESAARSETQPLGRVLTILDQRVIILQQESILRAVNWQKTLMNYLHKQWTNHLAEAQKQTVPLLTPIHLIHEEVEHFAQKLNQLGWVAQVVGPNMLALREIPRFLQGISLDQLNPTLLSQPLEGLRKSMCQLWIQEQPMSFKEIERLLESCHALSPELISSKDYVPDMLI